LVDEGARICRDLGQRIIELRRERGLTQEKLAEAVPIDARDLRRIEAGGNTTVETLVSVARALDVAIVALFVSPKSRTRRSPGRPKKSA
jgi:transcriptional regulator with XRE-family HTH domain